MQLSYSKEARYEPNNGNYATQYKCILDGFTLFLRNDDVCAGENQKPEQ